jgi:hypothetical protein
MSVGFPTNGKKELSFHVLSQPYTQALLLGAVLLPFEGVSERNHFLVARGVLLYGRHTRDWSTYGSLRFKDSFRRAAYRQDQR